MQGPTFFEDHDEVNVISATPTLRIPPRPTNGGFGGMGSSQLPGGFGAEMIVNPRKISQDALSVSSRSATPVSVHRHNAPMQPGRVNMAASAGSGSGSGSEYETEEASTESEDGGGGGGGNGDDMTERYDAERKRLNTEINEKKEILYQMNRLEAKGSELPRKFTMQSDLEEMRAEYHRILREKEIDASIRFQRKMLMAMVTGMEFLNTRFDPFAVKLDGWSEQVHENVNDYDDIFEELHEKYKSSGKKMAPEVRLLMSLSGSAFMFHLTNSMFKASPPGVEQVLRSDPELMKQFQSAAMQQMAGISKAANVQNPSYQQQQPNPASLFSMVGGMFNSAGGGGGAMRGAPRDRDMGNDNSDDVENIIGDIHAEISMNPAASRVETMSISDEEITSIIEDTADMNGLISGTSKRRAAAKPRSRKGPSGNTRTLDL